MKIGEVCLETNDVRRLADFYRRLFGIEADCQDDTHQFILNEETALTIYNDGSLKNNENINISLAFTVEDVDKEYARLQEMGITIIAPPTVQPWGVKNMHFCDPDGNHIYFRSVENKSDSRVKAVCIVGSPREQGVTAKVTDVLGKGLRDAGAEVKTFFPGSLNIAYCKGCMTCLSTRKCIQTDDMDKVMDAVAAADIVVVASPSYWGDITGQLKVFFDRSTPYGNTCDGGTIIPAGKKGIAVAVRAGMRQTENQHLVDAMNHYFSHLEIEPAGALTIESVMNPEDLSGRDDVLDDAYALGFSAAGGRLEKWQK